MRKVEGLNDIQPKNSSVCGGNTFRGNPNLFGTNKIETQKTYNTTNLKAVQSIEKANKTSKSIGDLMKVVAVLFATTTTGIVSVGAIMPTDLPKVEISEVYAYENEVSYFISLDKYEDGLKIVLYNDFTNRQQELEEQSMEGTFENLQYDMTYTFAIKKGSNTIASQKIRTEKKPSKQEQVSDYPETEEPIFSDEPIDEEPIEDDQGTFIGGGT